MTDRSRKILAFGAATAGAPARRVGGYYAHSSLLKMGAERTLTTASVLVFVRRQRRDPPHAQLAGVQKAPRHEVAGSWALATVIGFVVSVR
jgi:hypothetical protein